MPTTPLTVTFGFATVVVPSPSTVKMLEAVSVTAPVLVILRLVPTVVAPKVVVCFGPLVFVVSVVPTLPDTFNAPAAVRDVAPLLSASICRIPRATRKIESAGPESHAANPTFTCA